MEQNQSLRKPVGAGKIAGEIFGSLDRRLKDPIGVIFRFWGFVIYFFISYLWFTEVFLQIENHSITIWILIYGFYLTTLETTRWLANKSYDTNLLRSLRVGINVILISWLIMISSNIRPVLIFAYTVPIASAIAYFYRSQLIRTGVVAATIVGLYMGGIGFARERLNIFHFLLMSLVLVGFAYGFTWFYRQALHNSNNRLIHLIGKLPRTLDLQQYISEVLPIAIKLTNAEMGLLIIVNPRDKIYVAHDLKGLQLQPQKSIEDVARECWVLSSGNPFESHDLIKVFKDNTLYNKYFEHQPRSILAEPLFSSDGHVLGVLNVADSSSHRFDSISQNDLREFAFLISNAIENCFTYRQLKLREFQNREAGERFSTAENEDEVIQILLDEVCERIPHAEEFVLHRYQSKDGLLVAAAYKSLEKTAETHCWSSSMNKNIKPRLRLGFGAAGHALSLHQTLLIHDVHEHPWYVKLDDNELQESLLVAPLFDFEDGELFGSLTLENRRSSAFNLDDESVLSFLSTQASIALARLRDVQGLRDQGGALRRIFEGTWLFDLSAQEDVLCDQIVKTATETLGFKIARIRLLSKNEMLETIAITGVQERVKKKLLADTTAMPYKELEPFLNVNNRIESSYLIKHGNAEWDRFVKKYLHITRPSMHQTNGWHAYDALMTPLFDSNGNTIGILTLDIPKNGLQPHKQTLESIAVFAAAVSWILELSRFQRRLKDQQNRAQSLIDTISQELAKGRDIDTMGRIVVQFGAKLLSCEGCTLHLAHEGYIELTHSNYLANTDYLSRRKPVTSNPSAGLTAFVAFTGETLCFNNGDFKKHKAWAGDEDHLPYLPSQFCNSVLITPVKDKDGKVIGVLTLENKRTISGLKDFDNDDVLRLQSLANEFAKALDVIGLYEDIKEWERTGLAEDIHDLINWHHSGIIDWIEAIVVWLKRGNMEKVNELLPELRQHAFTFVQELKILHTNFRDESFEQTTFKQSLESTLSAWTKQMAPKYEKEKMRVRFNCPENLEIPAKIRNTIIRFASLAYSNALRHSGINENPDIEVLVEVEQYLGVISLAVTDNGRGIDRENNPPGFGIDRMRQLTEKINKWEEVQSDFRIETEPNHGTRVILSLKPKN